MKVYQPTFDKCMELNIYSFEVWKRKEDLLLDFPELTEKDIEEYSSGDIENPTIY